MSLSGTLIYYLRTNNMQKIFTKVATHMLTQMKRAETATGVCAYRGANGLMCAVGCLIPDELYSEDLERKSVLPLLHYIEKHNPHQVEAFVAVGINRSNAPLLVRLQTIHDRFAARLWQDELTKAAKDFNLEMPNVKATT